LIKNVNLSYLVVSAYTVIMHICFTAKPLSGQPVSKRNGSPEELFKQLI